MSTHTFTYDTRGLPASFSQATWEGSVEAAIANLGLPKNDSDPKIAATYFTIKGMLLLDDQFDETTAEFPHAIQQAWLETLGTVPSFLGGALGTMSNRDAYPLIADAMAAASVISTAASGTGTTGAATATGTNPGPPLIIQQFASVGRYVVAHGAEVPVGSPLFPSQVRLGMDRYVSGPPAAETLDIPELTGPSVQEAELDGQNMFVFSTTYAISQLHEMKAFYTVDGLTEDFLNGVLATKFDEGGKLLDGWFWGRRDRMTEPERMSVFSRMLGVPGGEVPRDIQPNTGFNDYLMGFLASVAEFDRQQRISDLFSGNLAGTRGNSLGHDHGERAPKGS